MTYPKYYMYPAIFQPDGDMWTVTFPDIDNAFTSSDSIEEAIIDARSVLEDCMYFREIQNDEIPEPSSMNELQCPSGGMIQMVAASMQEVRHLWETDIADTAAVSA